MGNILRLLVLLLASLSVAYAVIEENMVKAPLISGEVRREPMEGIVTEVNPESELKCFYEGSAAAERFTWFRIIENGEEESLEFQGKALKVWKYVEEQEGWVGFQCRSGSIFADFKVLSPNEAIQTKFRVKKFPKSFSVVDKQDLKVHCQVLNRTTEYETHADMMEEIRIRWFKWYISDDHSYADTISDSGSGNCISESMEGSSWIEIVGAETIPGETEPHIKLLTKDGVENAVIKIEDAFIDDRRGYKCVAYNLSDPEECSESAFFVRVKDKYAALWPFLGIVAEVIVLCIIIFACERSKSSKLPEEEEEQNGNGISGAGYSDNSNLRQRRT